MFIFCVHQSFSQCTINSCADPVILTGTATWTDGVEGTSNGFLAITDITLGNIDCATGNAGIHIYVYQLLPDGSRIVCEVLNPEPDNFTYRYSLGIGPASDCSNTPLSLPDWVVYDHENDLGLDSGMYLCEGGVYEVILAAYVQNLDQTIEDNQSVIAALNPDQYSELNLGTFFVNYTNEFSSPNPFPNPISTAVITGPNGESGTMTANCGEEVTLFYEGLSFIARCRFDKESIPNFYTFCDSSDPTMTNNTYSLSITSETENFISYTVNGGAPIIIRNGNGGDPATDAYGGQQTGPGNLPDLAADVCYTGICGARAIPPPDNACDGDEIVVTIQTVDIYSGQTVEDQMTITYTGENCNSCQPTCPSSADITVDNTEVCSGESITINGTTSGEGTGTFTITESSGTITEINEGVAFALPTNNTCEAVTYTFTATAICDEDGSDIEGGNLTVSVTVFPTDISAFVSTNNGECSTSVEIDASCGTNVNVNPSSSQSANAGESGSHNYTVSWSGGGPNCISELSLSADYNCPPDIVCPSSADIAVSNDQVCSGESITISGTTSGEGTGTFTITESSGTISEIIEGVAFALPENNTCESITYTFTATVVCDDDGSAIESGNLTVSVSVYPSDISSFVTANDGECSTSVTVDASCGNNVSVSPSDNQSVNAGESGSHNYTVSWSGGGPNCISDVDLSASYNCPPDIMCPSSADMSVNNTEVCSGESIIISGTTSGVGTGTFTISESSGAITEINEGVAFALPENNTCEPITYSFTATAVCDDDGSVIEGGNLSVSVSVYPSDINSFVTTNDGECSTSVTVDASCGNNISVSPSTSQLANAGESGTHNYTVSWTGGGPNCSSDLDLSAIYNCPPDIMCPSSADITVNNTEFCSGESITISGTTSGVGTGTFTISESSGAIKEINEGVAFAIPANNTCEIITYSFTATAVCDDDGSVIEDGNLSVSISVYPSDINSFVTANDGTCSSSVTVDTSCGNNVIVSPSASQSANAGESGTHNYTVSWSGDGPNCSSDVGLSASYNCPPDIMCPSSADITVNNTEVCSGESITISGTTSGAGTGTFTISESSGTITEINDGVAFALPENNTCEATTYTFTATAICDDDGSAISGANLTATVTVYPTDISAFVTANDGTCETSISIDASCGTNVSITPSESQTANPGESGIHNYTASWIGGGPNCVTNLPLMPAYDCIMCPTEASISTSASEVCSGESVTITGTTLGEGTASFMIMDESGSITDITKGVVFNMPANTTCAPVTYTFNAIAICDDDGSEIPGSALSVDIVVYPTYIGNFISSSNGECSTSVTVDASCGNNVNVSPSESQSTNPGETGMHEYTFSWVGGGPVCVPDETLFANYNCPPDVVCPASASISADVTEVCSGESVTITGAIMGEGAAAFTITESSGTIAEISDGIALILPENATCSPLTYTFNATATCADDGSAITNGTLSIDIIVYPSDISAFLSSNDGECSTNVTVDESCGNNISVAPAISQTAAPGESGMHNYTVSWVGGGPACLTDLNFTSNYDCPADIVCPASASINANAVEVCSGESVTITGEFIGDGAADYTIIETNGLITSIQSGVSINLPENNTCSAITYTFELSANCVADGSPIVVNEPSISISVYPSDISSYISTVENNCMTAVNIASDCEDMISVFPNDGQIAEPGSVAGAHTYFISWNTGSACEMDTELKINYTCDCIFDPTLAELELIGGSMQVCFGSSITYKAIYDGIDRDLGIEGGVDESYSAAFIIFIEPIDFNQPSQIEDALYRVTNDTVLTNDETIEPGTYYIYYYQGLDTSDPIGDPSLCKLYSQDFIVVEILPEINSGEAICTGNDNANEVTISVTDSSPDILPNNAYVESNGIQYTYETIDVMDSTKILNFINLPDGFYFFYYEDAQSCTSDVQLEFNCMSQTGAAGCTDPCASNYDPDAVVPDDSCEPYDNTCNEDCTTGDLSVWDEVSCNCVTIETVFGCIDEGACNYNENANCDDGSCEYSDCLGDCGGTALPGSPCIDNNGNPSAYAINCSCPPIDGPTTLGCTDPCADNYDPDAIEDDGSCAPYDNTCNDDCAAGDLTVWDETTCNCVSIETIFGCIDAEACNYIPDANCDDESCDYGNAACGDPCNELMGCTDQTACNYNPDACVDDGSCEAPPCNPGCTDPCADNYDPNASEDDGSCNPYDDTCNDDCSLGPFGGTFDFATCTCINEVIPVNGCTDSNACNFDPEANCDDGSCQVVTCNTNGCEGDIEAVDPSDACQCMIVEVQNIGCDDPTATNYDETVNCSDLSSCVYEANCTPPTPGSFQCDE